jgi:acyl-CoA thioesterase
VTRFDRDTAVVPAGDGVFDVNVDRGWWIVVGPNGGYVAALVLRAMEAALADPERPARSLTLHYVSPAVAGPARVHVRVERSGRSMSALSARLVQGERLIALGLGSFGRGRAGLEFQDHAMPEVPPSERIAAVTASAGMTVPLRQHFELRRVYGADAPGTSTRAQTGGWMRFREPRVPDAPALALFSDAWPPAISQRHALGPGGLRGVPTLDLTVHFRAPVPASARPDDFYLCVFRTQTAMNGFLEEDGEIWTRDGVLLAHSRQLALLI